MYKIVLPGVYAGQAWGTDFRTPYPLPYTSRNIDLAIAFPSGLSFGVAFATIVWQIDATSRGT